MGSARFGARGRRKPTRREAERRERGGARATYGRGERVGPGKRARSPRSPKGAAARAGSPARDGARKQRAEREPGGPHAAGKPPGRERVPKHVRLRRGGKPAQAAGAAPASASGNAPAGGTPGAPLAEHRQMERGAARGKPDLKLGVGGLGGEGRLSLPRAPSDKRKNWRSFTSTRVLVRAPGRVRSVRASTHVPALHSE